MPHIDELLGVATLSTAGLLVAIALQPLPSSAFAARADEPSSRYIALAADRPADARISMLRCDTGV